MESQNKERLPFWRGGLQETVCFLKLETITTKRGESVAPSAVDWMVSRAEYLAWHALRARKEPADGPVGIPRFLAIVSSLDP